MRFIRVFLLYPIISGASGYTAHAQTDPETAWNTLRETLQTKLQGADSPTAIDDVLAELEQFANDYPDSEPAAIALFNHSGLALAIGRNEIAEGSLNRAAKFTNDPQLAAQISIQLRQLALHPGKTPPSFTATTLSGKRISPETFDDRVVLLDFWATWCAPCIAELPNVQQVYDTHHESGFDIVSISLDQNKTALTRFLAGQELP